MSNPSLRLRGALCAVALLLAAGPLSAALVPLNTSNPGFADNSLNNGDTATDGSIVLTFGSVLDASGGSSVQVDSDGIYLGTAGNFAESFSIVFDTNTVIEDYSIGYRNPLTTGSFQLAGLNGTSGLNDLSSVGTMSAAASSRRPWARRARPAPAAGNTGRSDSRFRRAE